jgi:pentatricopeptide repeat protein
MEFCDVGASIEGSIHEMCAEVERKGILYGNAVVGTCLVEMYVQWGMLEKAHEVFDKLPKRNVVVWTALIGGYVQCDCCAEAITCFEQMLREGVDPDAAALACVLKGCASIGAIAKGSEVHDYIDRKGNWKSNLIIGTSLVDMYAKCGALTKATSVFYELCVHDVVSWNALIGGYAVHDCWEEEALCSLQRMKLEGVSPNAITYSCGVKACGAVGTIKKGAEIHCEIEQRALVQTNQFVGNAVIDMYMKCGMLAKALRVFNNLPMRNIVSWNTLITGYAQMGDLENASSMINRMNEQSIEPDQVTFASLLNACSHAGLVDHGKSYFVMMSRDYGIIPRVEQHTAIVDLLGRAGQLEMAIEMIHKVSSHPDIVMWLAILSACQKWGSMELGKKVFAEAAGSGENDAATLCNMFAGLNVD